MRRPILNLMSMIDTSLTAVGPPWCPTGHATEERVQMAGSALLSLTSCGEFGGGCGQCVSGELHESVAAEEHG